MILLIIMRKSNLIRSEYAINEIWRSAVLPKAILKVATISIDEELSLHKPREDARKGQQEQLAALLYELSFSSTKIQSACLIVESLCGMTMVVILNDKSFCRVCCIPVLYRLSEADVALSDMSGCGFLHSARAMAILCLWPPKR